MHSSFNYYNTSLDAFYINFISRYFYYVCWLSLVSCVIIIIVLLIMSFGFYLFIEISPMSQLALFIYIYIYIYIYICILYNRTVVSFKGLQPSLNFLSENETLVFQMIKP